MEGSTHKLGGAVAMLGTFEYLRLNGMTLEGVNPLIQLAIMYPASTFGAVMPDVDHHKGSNPIKTPAGTLFHLALHAPSDIVKRVNRNNKGKPRLKWLEDTFVLKHRSWQTHSLVLTGGATFALLSIIHYYAQLNPTFDMLILHMLISGFAVGLFSHLFLDMLTTSGVWLIMTKKVKLVPNNSYFSTGNVWEKKVVTNVLWFMTVFLTFSIILSTTGFELIPFARESVGVVLGTISDKMALQ